MAFFMWQALDVGKPVQQLVIVIHNATYPETILSDKVQANSDNIKWWHFEIA